MDAKLTIGFLTLSLLFLALSGCNHKNTEPDYPISEGIWLLAVVKSQSEQWTGTLKKDYSSDTQEYKKAVALYIPAKAAIDGWIAALKADMTGNGSGVAPQYQESLKQAAAKGHAYIEYVNQLYYSPPSPTSQAYIAPPIDDLFELLPEMAFKIWKEYRDAASNKEEDTKKKIIEQLDTLKWESFDKI